MGSIYVIMLVTLVGFFLLAFVLLYPFYKLIKNEQRKEALWTPDAIARRTRQSRAGGDGAGADAAPRPSYPEQPPVPRVTPRQPTSRQPTPRQPGSPPAK
ncbi:MAG: hypothetical protein AAF809_12010 [Bacteroidota bacterium]